MQTSANKEGSHRQTPFDSKRTEMHSIATPLPAAHSIATPVPLSGKEQTVTMNSTRKARDGRRKTAPADYAMPHNVT